MEKTNRIDQTQHHDFDIIDALQLRKDDIGRFLLRISIGGLMLFHGMNKLIYGTGEVEGFLTSAGMPAFFSFGVFIGEVLGPIMLILGYKTRLAAFFIVLDMLIATLLVHASDFAKMNAMGGWMLELNALYLLGAVTIMFLGSGRYALTKGKGALD